MSYPRISHVGSYGATLLLVLAASAAGVSAQAGGTSILTLLPSAGSVEIGSQTQGRLGVEDVLTTGGQRVKAFTLTGTAGDPLTVDVRSTDFDAYVFLVGPGYEDVSQDDDSGGACNARITTFLPSDGDYRIVVGGLGAVEGEFELVVDSRAHPQSVGECGGDPELATALAGLTPADEVLEVGASVEGTLDEADTMLSDGSYARAFTIEVTASQEFTADLTSSAFDSLLRLTNSDGVVLFTDDDGAGACNSRITFRPEESGELRLVVGTLVTGTGPFRLAVSEVPGPRNPGSCTG